jgi:hypothetical protein
LGSEFYETHMVAGHWLLADRLARGALERVVLRVLRLPVLTLRAAVRAARFGRLTPLRALWQGLRLARRRAALAAHASTPADAS